TASGERFDMYALTAAHKTLPMNARVRVVNLKNGRSVVVRINDRGPYSRGRIIDVSKAAARELGGIGAGVVPGPVEGVPRGPFERVRGWGAGGGGGWRRRSRPRATRTSRRAATRSPSRRARAARGVGAGGGAGRDPAAAVLADGGVPHRGGGRGAAARRRGG